MNRQNIDQRKIHDVTVLVHPGMPAYPGDPGLTIAQPLSRARGDEANVSSVSMGTHTGTHIDAPCHVVSDWPSLETLSLEALIGPVTVFELNVKEAITAADLTGLRWQGVERVLFKTRNSRLWGGPFDTNFVYVAEDAARWMAINTEVRLVGIDYLSIEKFGSPKLVTHLELLGHGIIILEGLDLRDIRAGEYELIALPLKLDVCDGAPCRAILIEQ